MPRTLCCPLFPTRDVDLELEKEWWNVSKG